MMELRKRNNNHEEPNREKLQKLEKELKKLETPIETRINVNLCLLVYWLPAYIIDFGAQFPTFNGIHIFTDFLSNWGQTVILGHLLFFHHYGVGYTLGCIQSCILFHKSALEPARQHLYTLVWLLEHISLHQHWSIVHRPHTWSRLQEHCHKSPQGHHCKLGEARSHHCIPVWKLVGKCSSGVLSTDCQRLP